MGNCISENQEKEIKKELPKSILEQINLNNFEENLWNDYCYPCYLLELTKKAYKILRDNKVENNLILECEKILKFSLFFDNFDLFNLSQSLENPGDITLLFSLFDKFLYQNDYYNEIDFTYQFIFLQIELYKLEGFTEEFIKQTILKDGIEIEEDGTKIFSKKTYKITSKNVKKMCEFYLKQIKKFKNDKWNILFHGKVSYPNIIVPNSNVEIIKNNYGFELFIKNIKKEKLIDTFFSYRNIFGLVYIYL